MPGHRELTLDIYLAILRRRRWLVLIPALLGAVAGYALSFGLPKKYTSHTLILVEQPTVPDGWHKIRRTARLQCRRHPWKGVACPAGLPGNYLDVYAGKLASSPAAGGGDNAILG